MWLLLNQRTKTCLNWKMRCSYKFHFDLSLKLRHSLHSEDKGLMAKLESIHQDWRSPVSMGTLWTGSHSRSSTAYLNSAQLLGLHVPKFTQKGGSAKHIEKGLSSSGDDYSEAVDCLQEIWSAKTNTPSARLCHSECPCREGWEQLQHLQDTANQHLRALKAMGCEPSEQFITSALELKFHDNTMFEWQKHSQVSSSVPHYSSLLTFLNLMRRPLKPGRVGHTPIKWHLSSLLSKRLVQSVAQHLRVHVNISALCVSKVQDDDEQMINTVKTHSSRMNCLNTGHMVKQYLLSQWCRRCQKQHHILLHVEVKARKPQVASQICSLLHLTCLFSLLYPQSHLPPWTVT